MHDIVPSPKVRNGQRKCSHLWTSMTAENAALGRIASTQLFVAELQQLDSTNQIVSVRVRKGLYIA